MPTGLTYSTGVWSNGLTIYICNDGFTSFDLPTMLAHVNGTQPLPGPGGQVVPLVPGYIPARKTAGTPASAVAEIQRLIPSGTVSGGSFQASWVDANAVTHTTPSIAFNATAPTVATALAGASNGAIPATCSANAAVVLSAVLPVSIFFSSPGPVNLITVDNTNGGAGGITGGGSIVVQRIAAGAVGDFVGASVGDLVMDSGTGSLYRNAGTPSAPIWAPSIVATKPAQRSGNLYGFLGDSVTALGETVPYVNGTGWASYGAAASKGQINYYANFGQGGDTTLDMLARIGAVIASPVTKCVVLGGINDISASRTPAQIMATLKTIYNILIANGIEPILCTVTPRGNQTTAMPQTGTLNFLIHDYACQKDLLLVDFMGRCVDPTTGGWINGTGTAANQMSSDGLHPTQFLGRRTMGQALADAVLGVTPRNFPWLATNIWDYDTSGTLGASILKDGLFLTATSGVGTGWAVQTGTGTATIPAPSGGENAAAGGGGVLGNWQHIVWATGPSYQLFHFINNAYAVGDVLQVTGRFASVVEAAGGHCTAGFQFIGTTGIPFTLPVGGLWDMDIAMGRFHARGTIPAGTNLTNGIYAMLNVVTGVSAMQVAQYTIVNRTTQGLS